MLLAKSFCLGVGVICGAIYVLREPRESLALVVSNIWLAAFVVLTGISA